MLRCFGSVWKFAGRGALALLLACALAMPAHAATYYVDPERGADDQAGTDAAPFRTINAAIEHLEPGDTLHLHPGVYLEHVRIEELRGTEDAPITIRGDADADVEIYAGLPYFLEPGNDHWERVPDGAPDEWRSTMELPSGGYHGQFLDTDIRLARYSDPNDFRAENELHANRLPEYDTRPGPERTSRDGEPEGTRAAWTYYGPGLRYNPGTRRLHIRLSHTTIARYAQPYYESEDAPRRYPESRDIARQTEIEDYTGPTDPRELALAIAPDATSVTLRESAHLEFRDLTIRNSLRLSGNEHITFRDVVFYPSQNWGRFGGDRHVRFLHCEFDGGMPPWHFRNDYKGPYWYRTPDGEVPRNNAIRWTNRTLFSNYGTHDLKIAYSEFRNAHDVYIAGVNTNFHHNLIEDIHDDGLFMSYPDEIENLHVHHNVMRRVLMGMAFHGNRPGVSRYVYRNIFDLREPARSGRPGRAEEQGSWVWRALFIAKTGEIGPLAAYQNTFLVRNHFTIMGGLAHPNEERPRQLFNNLFVSLNPSAPLFRPIDPDYPAQVDGNLWWRHGDAGTPLLRGFEDFDAFRNSDEFEATRQWYSPGNHAHDIHADPRFKRFQGDARPDDDLRLSAESPARGAGVTLPEELDDPNRPEDGSAPDLGARPYGAEPLRVGRHGRFSFPDEDMIALAEARSDEALRTPRAAAEEAEHIDDEDDGEIEDVELPEREWTGQGDGESWSDTGNWANDLAPGHRTDGPVVLGPGSAFTVRLDGEIRIGGGLRSTTFRGRPHLDLAGYRLILGDELRLGAPRHHARISNGTLTLGEPGRPAEWHIHQQQAGGGSVTLDDGAILDPANLHLLSIAEGDGNRGPTSSLNLSGAELLDDVLHAREIVLGRYLGSSARGGDGTLRLPDSARELSAERLLIGHNRRGSGSMSDPAYGRGTVDLGGGERLTLAVQRWLSLASGDHTEARFENLPGEFDLRLGEPEEPAGVRLAHKRLTQGEAGDRAAEAELAVPTGRLRAHLTELRVAHNPRDGGEAHGVLDLRDAQLEAFEIHGTVEPETYYRRDDMTAVPLYPDVATMLDAPVIVEGALLVGLGTNARGRVELPAGDAGAGWAFVGDAAEGSQGVLKLHGTRLALRQGLTVGAGGEVVVRASDGEGAIELTGHEAVLEIDGDDDRHGMLRVVREGEADATGPHIVLRWRGSHVEAVEALLEGGRITAEGGELEVIERDGWTQVRLR